VSRRPRRWCRFLARADELPVGAILRATGRGFEVDLKLKEMKIKYMSREASKNFLRPNTVSSHFDSPGFASRPVT
jgi:hypothetical protein